MSNETYSDFFTHVLQDMGINPTSGDLAGLTSVVQTEGTNKYFDPFNIEWHAGDNPAWQGTGAFNSVGVQEYANPTMGEQATAAYLKNNSHWSGVVAALQGGNATDVESALRSAYTWAPLQGQNTSVLSTPLGGTPSATTDTSGGLNVGGPVTGGGIAEIASGIVGGTVSAAEAVTALPALVAKLVGELFSVEFWIRVGFVIVGFVLLIFAVDRLTQGNLIESMTPSGDGSSVPEQAAEGASQAAGQVTEETRHVVSTSAKGGTRHEVRHTVKRAGEAAAS